MVENGGSTKKQQNVTAKMLRFLSHRLLFETDRDCCRDLKMSEATISHWKADNEIFQREYNMLFSDGVRIAKLRCRGLLGKAVDVVEGGMCDRSPAIRLKAAEMVLRTNGLLGDRLEHDVSERFGNLLEKLVAAGGGNSPAQ